MQYLWIGCWESEEEFKRKAKNGYDLAAAQISQQNIINGIEQISGCVFDSINGSVLAPYPIYKERIIKPIEWSHRDGAIDISVGYKNYKYVNRYNCQRSMINAADEWIKKRYKGNQLKILVYSMRSAPMAAACYIKRKIPQAKIYLFVTDLPQFMDLGQNKIKTLLKKIDWIFIKLMQKKIDGFILFAEQMASYLNVEDSKWMLMEGCYEIAERVENTKKEPAIMYSGKLDERYGVKMLVDAFMKVDGDYELWITGGGNLDNYIREKAKRDKRIRIYGFLPDRVDVLNMQSKASLLVNMRLPSEQASNYCFPSKLFEYMATGTPVLSFDIGGIPREYLSYLYIVDDECVDSLADAMDYIMKLSKEEVFKKGKNAALFIKEKKNVKVQCERIMSFLDGV